MPVRLDDLASSSTPTIASVPNKISVADAQNMGASAPIQYTEPKPPPDLVQRGEEDIEKPFIQVQRTIGASMSWLGDNIKDETPFGDLGSRIAKAGIVLQERSMKTLQDKFSNFTPNMLDDIVGAVPTVAGFLGAGFAAGAAGIPAAFTTGAIATAGGLGIASEEFNKLKMQGRSTPEADALATAIGVPVGGVMAAGFGIVGKLVEPWFKNMLGATITKMVGDKVAMLAAKTAGNAASGAAAFGAQAGVQDTGEMMTGIERKDAAKVLTDVTHNAIMGGVLGGSLGVSYALAQHAELVDGMIKLGFSPKEANQSATAVLDQGAHVLMDKIDQHLDYTKDENDRIQAPAAKGEVQPNVLERSGIPQDLNFSAVEQEAMPDQYVVEMSKDFKYVKLRPLNVKFKASPNATAQDIRKIYVGGRDQQMLENSYMHKDWLKAAPTDLEQRALFWGERSPEFIKGAIDDPQATAIKLLGEVRDLAGSKIPDATHDEIKDLTEKLTDMKSVFEQILNPTEGMKQVAAEGKIYYQEQGVISKAMQTINEIKENYYSSRLYKAAPLADFVKNLKSVNKKFSAHSLQRYYPDKFLALADGKEFRTENFADTTYDHATEMTQVNYSRQLQNAMTEKKPVPMAAWVREGAMPPGWKQIGTSRKLVFKRDRAGELELDENKNPNHYFAVFAAPNGLAEGLRPLTDPNYLKLIPGYQTLDKIQSFAKTGLLSASFFHHYTFAAQTLASFDGYKTLAELPSALKNDLMSEPGFREIEKRNVKYGLTTQETQNIQDVWADMNKGDDAFSKVLQKPILKGITDVVNANTDLLFKGMQRYIKNMTMSRNLAKWEGDHPGYTQEEFDEAAYGYAKATNDAFGGQNWEMLGWNRTQVALARLVLLAPDWVVSNISAQVRALKTLGDLSNTAGSQARWTLASGVIGGLAVNNILNFMRTGHSTLENKKGYKFAFEAAPDVYINNVRGGPGEALQLWSDIIESEGGQGFARYSEGKQSPLLSAYTRFNSGVDYSGGNIWKGHSALEKNVNGFWAVAAPAMGIPIGITGSVSYLEREHEKSLLGFSLVASGLGRFSLSGSGRRR